MAAVLFRLILLAGGLGMTEIGLGSALVEGSLVSWALVLIGLALIVAGTASFTVSLLGGGRQKGRSIDA